MALLIEVLSDNKNRTVPEIRHLLTKYNGNLGESGCVSWMFEKKGIILINKKDIIEDDILEILDLNVEDVITEDNYYEVISTPDNLDDISKFLENKKITIDGKVTLIPQNMMKVTSEIGEKAIRLISILEEHEDVQNIHSNFEIE